MSLAAVCTTKDLLWKRNLHWALDLLLKLNTPSDLVWKQKNNHKPQNEKIKSPNLFCAKQIVTEVNIQDRTVQLKERDKVKGKDCTQQSA